MKIQIQNKNGFYWTNKAWVDNSNLAVKYTSRVAAVKAFKEAKELGYEPVRMVCS